MAEIIDNERLEAEESAGFDFRKLWSIVVLNWYWIVLSTVLFVSAAFIYLRYQQPVYQVFTKILIKDERGKKTGGQELALDQLGLITNSNGFDNELEILSSTAVATRAVKELKLYVTYTMQGRIREADLYKTSPYIVDLEESRLDLLEMPIPIEITKIANGIHVQVQMPSKGEEPEFIERDLTSFPNVINTKLGKIMFSQNPGFEMPDRKLSVVIVPPVAMGRSYAKAIGVSPSSKTTTVAVMELRDTNVERAREYLLQLVESYNDDANEDKNEVAKKTEEFINERIEVIRDELD
ncbi:MAG: capsid assembly protein, partial [Prevotella sp.]|nr:capsid assembly protein [Prevotella sp.]